LLQDEREGRALVEESQLARGGALVLGVEVNATIQEIAMNVRHKRAHIATTVGTLVLLVGGLDPIDKTLHAIILIQGDTNYLIMAIMIYTKHSSHPIVRVGLVNGVALGDGRASHVLVGEDELADRGVIGETVDSIARGVDEHARGAVQDVATTDLVKPMLNRLPTATLR